MPAPYRTTPGPRIASARAILRTAGHAEEAPFAREAAPHPEPEARRPGNRNPRREALQALLGMAEALVTADDTAQAATTVEANATVRRFAEFALHLLGCQRMCLTALNPRTERLQPILGLGWATETERQWKAEDSGYTLRDSLPAALIRRLQAGEAVVVGAATRALPRYQPQEARQTLLAPLRIGSRLIGMLGVDYGDEPHRFSRQQRDIVSAVARLCATLFERERLRHEREAAYEDGLAAREEARRTQLSMTMVTHELRAPLTVIKAYQGLAERQLGLHFPDEEIAAPVEHALQAARGFLAQAQQASGRLSTLLEDLAQVSSAKAGKLRMRQQPCDLVDLVRETVCHVQRANPTRRVELRLPATRRVPVWADPERIAQVVTNYLTNAFKYSPADQPVEVRVRAWGQCARVAVRDRGPGLGAADKKAIWDSFYQAPGVQLQPGVDAGLGIGLYVCRTIVEQHAGQAGVESAVGCGSTFWFKLPISANAM